MASIVADHQETLKIRTLDNHVMEVTEKLINESTILMKAFEIHDGLSGEVFRVPVHSAGLKNAFKLLEFFDLDEPYAPESDYLVFQDEDHPGMRFLHGLSDENKAELKFVIEYLESERLTDCLNEYILNEIQGGTYRPQPIDDGVPESLKIRTLDNEIIKVPRNVIEESGALQNHYEYGYTDEKLVYFKSRAYPKALKVLELCDLDTQHEPLAFPAAFEPLTPALLAFKQANQPVMDHFNSLTNLDLYEITEVMVALEIRRIYDLFHLWVATLDDDKRTRFIRAQRIIENHFNGNGNNFVVPAGA